MRYEGELELYPRIDPVGAVVRGVRAVRTNWRRALAYSLVVLLLAGLGGYRWMTAVNPVDRASAVELFRAEDAAAEGAGNGATQDDRAGGGSGDKAARRGNERSNGPDASRTSRSMSQASTTAAGAGGSRITGNQAAAGDDPGAGRWQPPEEGVYSWSTDGYEQVSGARRQFPDETQRILTFNGAGNWTEHHYFSEQRESWTFFHWGERGAEVTQQRNKVTFGPVTNDSKIDFAPPMLVGPRDLRVGLAWKGSWEGDTYGNYESKVFEHTTLTIGGENVDVYGIAYEIELHGKQEGHVSAKVWLSPEHSLNVQERYVQDIESNGANYHAEWMQTLKSLRPQR